MKSIDLIDKILSRPDWTPKPHSYAEWFNSKLLELGFCFNNESLYGYQLKNRDLIITVAAHPNVVILDKHNRSFIAELYCQEGIPQNDVEFDQFWKNIKSLI